MFNIILKYNILIIINIYIFKYRYLLFLCKGKKGPRVSFGTLLPLSILLKQCFCGCEQLLGQVLPVPEEAGRAVSPSSRIAPPWLGAAGWHSVNSCAQNREMPPLVGREAALLSWQHLQPLSDSIKGKAGTRSQAIN